MALIVTACVNERGTVDAGERMGDPIRKRKLRVSPSARLIGVRLEYDERELQREHRDLMAALQKSHEVQEAFVVSDSRGLLKGGRHKLLDVETMRTVT